MMLYTNRGEFVMTNGMRFSSPIYLTDESDVYLYHIEDDRGNVIGFPKKDDIVYVKLFEESF